MTYLYAGLGMAMLAAIVAMVEMAMAITGQQLQSRPPQDPYFDVGAAGADQQMLRLIFSSGNEGGLKDFKGEIASVCGDSGDDSISKRVKSDPSRYPDLINYSFEPVKSGVFVGGCAGVFGLHRLIVVPSEDHFSIYSCVLEIDSLTGPPVCPLEEAS